MRPLDWLVIALYAVAMLAIGRHYSRRTETVDDYLLGGRRMSPFMIGVSLFATITSTLSYLAVPGEIVKNGPMILAQYASFPIVYVVVGWWLIPSIMAQRDVTSGYELLERRLGVVGRLLGAGMFILLRTFWMAAILYATCSTVIVPLFHLDPSLTPWLCVALGALTVVYTAEGGMRAVVMTDALQCLIMFAGAIATVGFVSWSLGGVGGWWPTAWAPQWQAPVFWFRSDVRITFAGAMLYMLVWMTCTCGSDQMAIQRYLSTRDVAAARRAVGIHLAVDIVVMVLLGLVGLAVFGYFNAHPEAFGPGASLVQAADQLFPRFVEGVLPAGLSGLVVAAMLSAAMSSLSSGMNSASAVIVSDFLGRLRGSAAAEPHAQIRLARIASVAIGAVAIAISMVVPGLASNLLELCVKFVNLLTGPIFTLFFLAIFVPWSTPAGAVVATLAGVTTAVGISFFGWGGLEFLWIAPCSLAVGIVAGMLASLVTPGRGGSAPAATG
jgi:SSS family solute:Na+ symporter